MDRMILENRLAALHDEFSSGKRLLAEHDVQAGAIREQLLRISGAIRVLSELLEPTKTADATENIAEPSRGTCSTHSSLAQ